MQDWAKLWRIRDTRDPVPLPNADHLLPAACQHAATLPEISLGHLANVLKHLPDRAAGPDGIPTQLLTTTSADPQVLRAPWHFASPDDTELDCDASQERAV